MYFNTVIAGTPRSRSCSRQGPRRPGSTASSCATVYFLHHRPPPQPEHQVSLALLLLLCVPVVVPWGRHRPSPRDQAEPVHVLLRAAAQTASLVCRSSCRALRLQVPLPSTACAPRLTVTSVCPSCRALAAMSGEHRPFPVAPRAPSTVRSLVRAQAKPSRHPFSVPLPCARRARCHLGPGPGRLVHTITQGSRSLPFGLCSSVREALTRTHARGQARRRRP
jgi:hypothetical protein